MDNLVELDSDPEVMRYINGGKPTPREYIRNELLPTALDQYRRAGGYGRWAAVEKSTAGFIGWFGLRPAVEVSTSWSSGTGCAGRRGATATPPKDHAR